MTLRLTFAGGLPLSTYYAFSLKTVFGGVIKYPMASLRLFTGVLSGISIINLIICSGKSEVKRVFGFIWDFLRTFLGSLLKK